MSKRRNLDAGFKACVESPIMASFGADRDFDRSEDADTPGH